MTPWPGYCPLCTSDHRPTGHDPGCAARNRAVDGWQDRQTWRAEMKAWTSATPAWLDQMDQTPTVEAT